MSKASAAKFVQAIMEDEALCKRTENTKPEDAVSFAKELGYDFTLEELAEAMNEGRELSPDDLASVTGESVIGGRVRRKTERKKL